uniref:Lysozyme C, milk isozyme n=1 Tax=Lygus hesperus TaxID=30085 RepID=A0A0A9WFJ6_LYGHE
MMGAISVAFVVIAAVVSCSGRVFTPCELAKQLKYVLSSNLATYLGGNVSLAVCLAGYRHYNASYQLKHPNGTVYYGVFGLKVVSRSGCDGGSIFINDSFDLDLYCLNSTVLIHPNKLYMYHRLCASDLTQRFTCKENEFFHVAEVWDPIYKDIIDLTYGEEHAVVKYLSAHGIDYYQPPTTTTTSPPTTTTSPSTTTTIIISTTVMSLMIGLIVVTYHFLKKFMRGRIAPTASTAPEYVMTPRFPDTSNQMQEEISHNDLMKNKPPAYSAFPTKLCQ